MAATVSLERCGTPEAVEQEFRVAADAITVALKGVQNDVAAMVLHSALVAVLEDATEKPRIN